MNLFNTIHPLDSNMVEAGEPISIRLMLLDSKQHLDQVVNPDEIRKTMFEMGHLKALGPNGF